MKFIETFREGDSIADIYLCKSKTSAVTKNGKSYESIILQDKTGSVDAKIWDPNSHGIDEFESLDYIYVRGDVISFNGMLQLNVKRIQKADEDQYDTRDYLPVSTKEIEGMFRELVSYMNQIKNPYLKQLLQSFFAQDEAFIKAFKFHSAAKSVHHGFVGGLLEHTLSVVKLCAYYCAQYPILNKDLLLTAAMFHDIGKIEEISPFPVNDYTDDGQLLGHIMIGVEKIAEQIRLIDGFPLKLSSELKHCILAHHGELEYGSPKKPAIAEALALHYADNTDAKLQTMSEILNSNVNMNNNDWLGYNRYFESNLRRTSAE